MQGKIGDGVFIAGRVIRDADFRLVGDRKAPKASFGVAVERKMNGAIVNVEAWDTLAELARLVKKGDRVAVAGSVREDEYNGKTRKTLAADWLSIATPQALQVDGKEGFDVVEDNEPLPWE